MLQLNLKINKMGCEKTFKDSAFTNKINSMDKPWSLFLVARGRFEYPKGTSSLCFSKAHSALALREDFCLLRFCYKKIKVMDKP